MRHSNFLSVLLVLATLTLLPFGYVSRSVLAASKGAPACGQSKVLGEVTKVYDSSQDCLKGLKDLKDKAKDDAIGKCKNYCDFLSDKCEMSPTLTRENVEVADYTCNKQMQDDNKIHLRVIAEKECTCKPKEQEKK